MRNSVYTDLQIAQMIYNSVKEKFGNNPDMEVYIRCAEENLITRKRKWRDWLKKQNDNHYDTYVNGYIVNGGGDYDYSWEKIFFPGEYWTDEEKNEFIEWNWHHYVPTYYDCTGQIFTWSIDCFNVPSGVVCYIREAMDV